MWSNTVIEKAYILYIDDDFSRKWSDECAASCDEHSVPYEKHRGYVGMNCNEITKMTGWVCGRPFLEDNDTQYYREYNAALGHIEIWQKIAAGDKPCAILEHDAIVKKNFCDLEMIGDVMYLGPRVHSRHDYEFPNDYPLSYIKTPNYEGLHAYVISPRTAKFLLEAVNFMKRILPTEGMISVLNPFCMDLRVVDPAYVVCELGGRKSFTMADEISIKQNYRNEPGTLAGMKDPSATYRTLK